MNVKIQLFAKMALHVLILLEVMIANATMVMNMSMILVNVLYFFTFPIIIEYFKKH